MIILRNGLLNWCLTNKHIQWIHNMKSKLFIWVEHVIVCIAG